MTPAGPQLDAEIATLMGWKNLRQFDEGLFGNSPTDGPNHLTHAVPKFSTTWEGMGLVMEWLRTKKWDAGLENLTWMEWFFWVEGPKRQVQSGTSVAEVVCRCVLEAAR